MRRVLPWLWIVLAPLVLFPGVLVGRHISADDHLSVHHVTQDAAGGHVRHPALSDPALQFAALQARVVHELRSGAAPLWNPDLYAGTPLLADGQSAVGSPVTWLKVFLPRGPAGTLGALLVLLASGSGAVALARRLRLSDPAAAVVGVAVVTTPYLSVWLLHPHAWTLAWLPWLLWSIEDRRGPWVAAFTALVVAGGHPETAVHALALALIWWAARVRNGRGVLGALAGLALAAPFWLPFAFVALDSATASAHGGNRLLVGQLSDLVWPSWSGHPAVEGYTGPGIWADGVLHPGVACLVLALASLRQRWGQVLVGAWVVLVGLALLGTPLVNSARLGGIAALALALAAGFALPRAWARSTWAWLAPALVLASGVGARWYDQGTLETLPEPAAWSIELAERAGEGRVTGLSWALQPNTGALAGLRDVRGYDLPVSHDTEAFMRALDRRLVRPWFPIESVSVDNRALLEFAAVRYVVAPEPQFGLGPVQLDFPAPLEVYVLDEAAPRAWLATGARPADAPHRAADFTRAGYATRGAPAVEGLAAERWPEEGDVLAVQLSDVSNREVVLELPERQERAIAVLADRHAPGWLVEVDGVEAELLRVGGFFRGVVVEPEARQVRFTYRPAGWRAGLGLGLLGALGIAGLIWRGRGL
ncbi:MAG: hypothetical protein GY913_12660 [Proteobacteria bacterium]|nr:hypothetical protein [Pseudomonadota bacterium]MCP4917757.1 hypothetical protein [Pseudomonadota bacterium]